MKKRICTIIMLLAIAVVSVSLAATMAFADAQPLTDCNIIADADGAFAGVDVNLPTGGALTAVAKADATATTSSALITYNIESVKVSDADGLLLYISRPIATGNFFPFILLQTATVSSATQDYELFRAYATDNKFINASGSINTTALTAETTAANQYKYKLEKMTGTMYIPFASVKTGSGSSVIASNRVITAVHIVWQTNVASQLAVTHQFMLSSISSVKVNADNLSASTVNNLFDATTLSYTSNAEVTDCDVNLADMSKGTKVYVKNSISGMTKGTDQAAMTTLEFARTDIEMKVNYSDASGNVLAESTVSSLAYSNDFAYSVTPKEINGYVFDQTASPALTGNAANNFQLNLVYNRAPGPELTIKYVDEVGSEIKAQAAANVTLDETSGEYSYDCGNTDVFGYTFVNGSKELTGAIVQNDEIILTYRKNVGFTAVTDGGAFVGVTLDSAFGANIKVVGDGGTVNTTDRIAVSFAIKGVRVGDCSGMLIQIDRSMAGSGLNPRFMFETDGGVLYKAITNDCAFVSASGVKYSGSLGNAGDTTFSIIAKSVGTLYIPFTSITSTGMLAIGSEAEAPASGTACGTDTVFVKVMVIWQTTSAAQRQTTRPMAIGSIGAVKIDAETPADTVAEILLDSDDLTYSVAAEDTECDVNLADMTKGKKVFSTCAILGNYGIETDEAIIAEHLAYLKYSRSDALLIVKFVDAAGEEIATACQVKCAFNADGTFDYALTETNVNGYLLDVENSPALSGTIPSNTAFNLTYSENPAPRLTVNYVDAAGKNLCASELGNVATDAETGAYSYSVTPKKFFGYKYDTATLALSGTLESDTSISLKYATAAIDNYDEIFDAENKFVGINIKNSAMGALMVVGNNSGSATAELGITTYEMSSVCVADCDGLLIKIDRTAAEDSCIPRILLETSDGALYKVNTRAARDDLFINADGTVSSLVSESYRYNMEGGINGTLFIPWSVVNATGSVMPGSTAETVGNSAVPENTVFTKLHYALDTRAASWQGVNRPTAICTIAALSVLEDNTVITEQLLDVASLTYTNDAENSDADVNMGDYTKGKTVYMVHSMTGSYQVDTNETDRANALSVLEFKRLSVTISLVFINEAGQPVKADSSYQAIFDDDGNLTYTFEAPEIVGYDFKSSDLPLSGTIEEAVTITLTYAKKTHKITLVYVDADGNSIKDNSIIDCVYGDYKEIAPDEIEGYTFSEASNTLKLTVISDKTITLTYTKNPAEAGGGCGGNFNGGSIFFALAAVALAVVLKKKGQIIA